MRIADPIDVRALVMPLILVGLFGCTRSRDTAHYVPDLNVSQQALTLALDAWQQGGGTFLTLDGGTDVHVVDRYRLPGQTLRQYRILGEVSGDGGRWFQVELQLEHPEQKEQRRYIVVGIDPLWVFQQKDYELLAHWDHPMPNDT